MSRFALKDLTGKVSGLYSDEQKQYLKSLGKCPHCGARGAADLVDGHVTLIFAAGGISAVAAKATSSTVPIVFVSTSDP